ncbi:acyl carrier protein [Oceanivirga salmonicida]|uniref:acyl carrier protein n=1 Tax=Oceanivirga salmonicida TaxID=1769291 RepID=UPI00083141C8|nr:acyl carrier protein [Oceanivirga salmonicida]
MFEEIKEIILEQLDVNENEIQENTSLIEDLGADSLDVAEIISEIENKFEVELEKEKIEKIKTIKDIMEYLEK